MSQSIKSPDTRARELASKAIETLEDVMENAIKDSDRIKAAETILDRGYGKAAQAVISIPADKQNAALLANLSDEQLVAIIEQKKLPSLAPSQPLITVPASAPAPAPTSTPRPSKTLTIPPNSISVHGPVDSFGDEPETPINIEIDPLLL